MTVIAGKRLSKGGQRQIAILDVAESLFLSKGFSEVTLEMITREAGGSRRVVYEKFGDKNGLFEVVCERIFKRVHEELENIQTDDRGLREALTQLGRRLLTVLTSYPVLPLFELILSESRRFPAIGQLFYRAVPGKAYVVLATYLDKQVAAGEIRVVDTSVAARQFLGMIREDVHLRCILQPDYRPSKQDIDKAVSGAVDTFLHALALEGM